MKWLATFLILLIYIPVSGQELSLHIPVSPDKRNDLGIQMVALDDGFLVAGTTFCHEPSTYDLCFILLRLDGQGNKLWGKIFDGSPDTNLDMEGWTLVVYADTIYVACEIWKTDHKEFRLMSFDMNGNPLSQQDLAVSYTSELFARGMKRDSSKLLLYGEVNNNGNKQVFIEVLDFQFNVLEEHLIGDPSFSKAFMELNMLQDGGYILAYGEGGFLQVSVVFKKLDENFDEVFSKKMLQSGEPLTGVNLYQTEDKGYMLAWQKDLSFSLSDTFPFPTTIYKLDSLANVEWEYVFAHRAAYQHSYTIKMSDGKMFGIGATDYYDFLYQRSSDGWCFLMDTEGNLLWERSIADIRDSDWGRLWHGLETDNGFALVGDIAKINPTGVPFQLDGEVWFLTLDENGCWNGNCEKYIVITGDTTSITDAKEVVKAPTGTEAYPNPTTGILTIECEGCNAKSNRAVKVFDATGRKVLDTKLYAPKSTINLSHLPDGLYIVTCLTDGQPSGTHKVIVHH